jgi:hypothetical protein
MLGRAQGHIQRQKPRQDLNPAFQTPNPMFFSSPQSCQPIPKKETKSLRMALEQETTTPLPSSLSQQKKQFLLSCYLSNVHPFLPPGP